MSNCEKHAHANAVSPVNSALACACHMSIHLLEEGGGHVPLYHIWGSKVLQPLMAAFGKIAEGEWGGGGGGVGSNALSQCIQQHSIMQVCER